MAISETSDDANTPAVIGENMAGGDGVYGRSTSGRGVLGSSETGYGLDGESKKSAGVRGTSVEGRGVEGWSTNGEGVWGISTQGHGISGYCTNGSGVLGSSETGYGVDGESKKSAGVRGTSVDSRGVEGWSTNGEGVWGISTQSTGVHGESESSGTGVFGRSEAGEGVHGESNSQTFAAVAGIQLNPNSTGAGLYGEHRGNGPASFFKGDVLVTGDIKLINADCAEDFDITGLEKVEPGTVMVIDQEGALRQSEQAYDKRVAGVISGAGNYKPGLILDKQESSQNRMPIALLGKVYCKVDAQYGVIKVGDLLTTSPTPGYAMKATDSLKAFGTVIGKALRPLTDGQRLIPILIALQ